MAKANLKDAQVTVLMIVDNKVCLVAMDKDKVDGLDAYCKVCASQLYDTGKDIGELREFLGLDREG